MENVMVKTCLNHKIIKNSNLIQAMKNNGSPKATVIRRPNFSESRIFPKAKFVRIFAECSEVWIGGLNVGGLNARHDNRLSDVKWHLFNFFESRICTNIYRMFRSVDWTHDMIIVKWHLFIWHERKLCALTNAPPVQSTQTGQWLSTLFSASRSCLCLVPSAIHLRSKL